MRVRSEAPRDSCQNRVSGAESRTFFCPGRCRFGLYVELVSVVRRVLRPLSCIISLARDNPRPRRLDARRANGAGIGAPRRHARHPGEVPSLRCPRGQHRPFRPLLHLREPRIAMPELPGLLGRRPAQRTLRQGARRSRPAAIAAAGRDSDAGEPVGVRPGVQSGRGSRTAPTGRPGTGDWVAVREPLLQVTAGAL